MLGTLNKVPFVGEECICGLKLAQHAVATEKYFVYMQSKDPLMSCVGPLKARDHVTRDDQSNIDARTSLAITWLKGVIPATWH